MIKKILLTILTCSTLTTYGDNFYIKGGIGTNVLNPFKIKEENLENKAKLMHSIPLIEAGIGYNFGERIRTEIIFDYYFMFNLKETCNNKDVVTDFTRKVKINALFANAYIDFIKFDNGGIFLGGGIGSSFQKEKAEGLIVDSEHYGRYKQINKHINQFAYKLTAGADFKLNNELNFEMSYNYFDLGKSIKSYRYKLHNLTLGIRYNL